MKNKGLSPTFGTLILVIILLISIGISFYVVESSNSVERSVQAGVDVKTDVDGVTVTWEHRGNAQNIVIMSDSKEITQLTNISESATVQTEKEIQIIAVRDNTRTTLDTVSP